MPLTLDAVRTRIQDYPRLLNETRYGDGTATRHMLTQRNLTTASAFVPVGAGGGTAWSATGCMFNPSGWVDFSGVISANSAFRLEAVYSVFSDAEVGEFTAVGGSVNGAALEAVKALRFDGLKRARWSAPDGTSHDDTAALAELARLYDALKAELAEEATAGGSVESWSLNQEVY